MWSAFICYKLFLKIRGFNLEMTDLIDKAREFLELLQGSSRAVVFTGAGVSTESGIPDYRSPGTGTWEKMDPSVVSLDGFYRDPAAYYRYALEMYPARSQARPNPAHQLLAELEAKGMIEGVITQNVDGLHRMAGSQKVYELHGSIREAVCLDCSAAFPMNGVMERVKKGEIPPVCDRCKGDHLKPKAVFFGEALPQDTWREAMELVPECDLLVMIGSSLQVSPANSLPDLALRSGSKLVIINLMPTPYDDRAHILINEKVGEFASSVIELLEIKIN